MTRHVLFNLSLLAVALTACDREKAPPRTAISPMDATAAPVAGMAHGNHNPKHGGVVLMREDLHFEVVAKDDGHVAIYFSDAARHDLPASAVTDVKAIIQRPGFRGEHVDLKISDTGENWEGKGGNVDDRETNLQLSYTLQGKPLTADMPFFAAEAQKGSAPKP
jgi:hypothetical protein